ncbi:MAG: hypothetical protein IPP14_10720 [Planctomycetes bacterium]|nr:hypothetical protein [Planctomycetota bacterium]
MQQASLGLGLCSVAERRRCRRRDATGHGRGLAPPGTDSGRNLALVCGSCRELRQKLPPGGITQTRPGVDAAKDRPIHRRLSRRGIVHRNGRAARPVAASPGQAAPEEREAVALCHVGGLTQAQASQTTGVNLNTFKARASRGLARLRETLQSRPGSVEAYLTSMAIPLPAEGVEAALARWRQGAVGAATPGLTLTSLPAIAALAAAMVALLAVLWLAMDAGGLQAEANPRAPQIAVENTLPVAGTPPEAAQVPTVVQDGKLGADSEVGGVVGRDSTDASATIDTAEETPQSAATRPADTLNPPGALAPGSLRVRTSFYESGERYMQWTELVQTTGAIRVGSFAAYFPSGRVQEVGQYVHDKKEGTWTKYYENGAMFYRGDYLDGRPEGPWIFHSAEDRPATEGSYKNGKREGLWRMFHDNGQIKRNITYQDDQAEGQSIEFDDQGRKRRETQWHEGARVSQRQFDENGNLVE